jgi:hypothetical protein
VLLQLLCCCSCCAAAAAVLLQGWAFGRHRLWLLLLVLLGQLILGVTMQWHTTQCK